MMLFHVLSCVFVLFVMFACMLLLFPYLFSALVRVVCMHVACMLLCCLSCLHACCCWFLTCFRLWFVLFACMLHACCCVVCHVCMHVVVVSLLVFGFGLCCCMHVVVVCKQLSRNPKDHPPSKTPVKQGSYLQ